MEACLVQEFPGVLGMLKILRCPVFDEMLKANWPTEIPGSELSEETSCKHRLCFYLTCLGTVWNMVTEQVNVPIIVR